MFYRHPTISTKWSLDNIILLSLELCPDCFVYIRPPAAMVYFVTFYGETKLWVGEHYSGLFRFMNEAHYNMYSRVLGGDELIMTRYRERSACHSFSSQSSIWETIGPFVAREHTTPSWSYQQWLSGGRHNVMGYSCSFGLFQISMKQQWRKKKKKAHSWDEQGWGVPCQMLRVMSMHEYICPPYVPLPLCRN